MFGIWCVQQYVKETNSSYAAKQNVLKNWTFFYTRWKQAMKTYNNIINHQSSQKDWRETLWKEFCSRQSQNSLTGLCPTIYSKKKFSSLDDLFNHIHTAPRILSLHTFLFLAISVEWKSLQKLFPGINYVFQRRNWQTAKKIWKGSSDEYKTNWSNIVLKWE